MKKTNEFDDIKFELDDELNEFDDITFEVDEEESEANNCEADDEEEDYEVSRINDEQAIEYKVYQDMKAADEERIRQEEAEREKYYEEEARRIKALHDAIDEEEEDLAAWEYQQRRDDMFNMTLW